MEQMKNNLSILIMEDEPSEQFIMHHAIHEVDEHARVEMIKNERDLLDFFLKDEIYRELNRQSIPDLVLLNVKNSSFDLSSLQKLKARVQYKDLPVILLSGRACDPDIKDRAIDMGARSVFKNPDTYQELKAIVGDLLRSCA